MYALTMESSVFSNLRIRFNADEVTCLVMWNDPDDACDKCKEALGPFWEHARFSRAGNWYIKAVLAKKIHPDCIKKFGNEMPLDRCALETKWVELDACGKIVNKMKVVITDGVYDDIPGKRPQGRHPAADRPNKDVVKIPGDIILDVKPLRSKWNLKLDRKKACSNCLTKDDLMSLEKVADVQFVGDQLWLHCLYIEKGTQQPTLNGDIYLNVFSGTITTKHAYNNYIVRVEAKDIVEIEGKLPEVEQVDICGHNVGFRTKAANPSFSITVCDTNLDKSEINGLMWNFHGSFNYLSSGHGELSLEFELDATDTYPWHAVTAIIFDCKTRKAHKVIGCTEMDFKVEPEQPKFKFINGTGFVEPKTFMVSSSCFTRDDRRKFEDAMVQQVAMKRLLLNSRYGITTSPADEWIRSGFDFDGDVVSADKLREWTTREDIERAEKDFNEFKAKQLINKRKGVKIMKKTDKTGPTVQEVFDSLTPQQRDVVYFLIGEAIKENGGTTMVKNPVISSFIKEVIFEGPATIVMWQDGTKTVVKAQHGEEVDREKGLALAMAKKFYNNDKNYFDRISMQVFGYNLRNLMKKRGLKAKDIAEAMKENKVTVPMVELWMRGTGKINSNRVTKLAKILGVKEEALFAAKDKKPSRSRAKKKTAE